MTNTFVYGKRFGARNTRIDQLASDGVSCAVCHQIADERLGTPESFTGGFVVDTSGGAGTRPVFGPFDVDPERTRIMQSATGFQPTEAAHIQSSDVCATCHTLYTHALNTDSEEIAKLAEQVPYLEWWYSGFSDGENCQACHMPVVEDATPIASVLGEPRDGLSRHIFRGGNFFMLRMLNRYRAELGVVALPQELEAAAQRTVAHLQTEAATIAIPELSRSAGGLRFSVAIENRAGHKLPTAYHRDLNGDGETVFESGAFEADGSIRGNDSDAAPDRFEPHYAEITTPDQVQIYESIMVGEDDVVTTGLLTGVRYIKDNRLLPRGFDSAAAVWDVAVAGVAASDPDFAGGVDQVRYAVDVQSGVEAEFWYQPIGFRWAQSLARYDAFETRRFVRYYDTMSASSAIVLATAEASE